MGKLSTLQNIISWEHNLLSCAQKSLLSSAHDIISCHLHSRIYLCAQDNVSCTREYVLCTQENNYFLPVFLLKKKYFCVSNLPLYMLNGLITSNIKTSIFCISGWINFWKILDRFEAKWMKWVYVIYCPMPWWHTSNYHQLEIMCCHINFDL